MLSHYRVQLTVRRIVEDYRIGSFGAGPNPIVNTSHMIVSKKSPELREARCSHTASHKSKG